MTIERRAGAGMAVRPSLDRVCSDWLGFVVTVKLMGVAVGVGGAAFILGLGAIICGAAAGALSSALPSLSGCSPGA
jgi:hypothetical protein